MRILRIENGLGASKILRDIKQSFDLFADSENDFKVKNVEIISGTKEGLYCWIATNYLMDFLPEEQSKINGTVGTLDMGGASAQIAFQVGPARVLASKDNASEVSSASEPLTGMNESSAPSATATIMSEITTTDGESGGLIDASGGTGAAADAETTEQRAEHKVKERTQLFGREYRVSTFSNLCFGNDDARKRFQMLLILQHPESRIVHDPCTHPRQLERIIDSEELSKNVCTYDPNGERRQLPHPEYKFIAQPHVNRCAQLTRQLVSVESVRQNFKDHDFQVLEQPPPKDMRFFAMATFYFAAKQLRNREIVSFQSEDEMAAAVSDYCQRTWDDVVLYRTTKEMHYVKNFCFSVNYVFNYLKHVYRFRKEQFAQIEFRGQLGGHSLGWALGYMLQETNRIPGSGPKPPIINGLWFTILILFSAALLLFAAGSVVKKHISNKGEYMATQVSPMNKQSRV